MSLGDEAKIIDKFLYQYPRNFRQFQPLLLKKNLRLNKQETEKTETKKIRFL
jgi:hypothetical protein